MTAKKTPKNPRIGPTKAVSDAVLNEFDHKCAICGASKPHLHHIDEDPSNSTVENLLPLCPNHHLYDAHDPTRRHDILKIQLFRRCRDPFVLDPRFEPIWKRLKFLWLAKEERKELSFKHQLADFVDFLGAFKMGSYYGKAVESFFATKNQRSQAMTLFEIFRAKQGKTDSPWGSGDEVIKAEWKTFYARWVEDLCVEMIRYQDWETRPKTRAE